jgi:hypothetical protein
LTIMRSLFFGSLVSAIVVCYPILSKS